MAQARLVPADEHRVAARAASIAVVPVLPRPSLWGRLLRAVVVSLGMTVLGQALLAVLVAGAGWRPVLANLTAVTATSVPSFLLNRAWVWRMRGDHRLVAEALPFWAHSLAGLLLSTAAVAVASAASDATWAVNVASLLAWSVSWPAGFLLNDLVLFRHRSR